MFSIQLVLEGLLLADCELRVHGANVNASVVKAVNIGSIALAVLHVSARFMESIAKYEKQG